MTNEMIVQLLEEQRKGNEPFFTPEGGAEFFRLLMQFEEENEVEVSA